MLCWDPLGSWGTHRKIQQAPLSCEKPSSIFFFADPENRCRRKLEIFIFLSPITFSFFFSVSPSRVLDLILDPDGAASLYIYLYLFIFLSLLFARSWRRWQDKPGDTLLQHPSSHRKENINDERKTKFRTYLEELSSSRESKKNKIQWQC